MQIINKKISELKEYENNPRDNTSAIEAVANSIKEFGFKVPIIVDNNNIIIAGHTRYKAAISLGLIEVPCIIASDLTPEQVKALLSKPLMRITKLYRLKMNLEIPQPFNMMLKAEYLKKRMPNQ